MSIATIGLVWLAVSVPTSCIVGFFLRGGEDAELIALDGHHAVVLLPDGTVARTATAVPA
jgi:hypothetical protein